MSDLDVRIVRLEPMRVASVRAMGMNPENDAWEQLRAWAEPKGLFGDFEKYPVYGFNNPSPTKDKPEYGYEFWLQVGPEVQSEGEVEVKEVPGGLYAVTSCKIFGDPQGSILDVWKRLLAWVEDSEYSWRHVHELEKPHDPLAPEEELVLDLYLPIEE
ncbi:MAG: GyrI-like domain-containing protein [Fidelibacterota bacterium]|nr:MAG: GyrI-like domain-containing protein [Candidatus Neomarinimicrobiota bacterium]